VCRLALSLLLLSLSCLAGAADLRAGSGQLPGTARALALQGNSGGRIVFVVMDAPRLSQNLVDLVAARSSAEFELDRSEIVFYPAPDPGVAKLEAAQETAGAIVSVIGAAIGALAPASVEFRSQSSQLSVSGASPEPLAVPLPLCGLAPASLPAGPLTGPIRSAFQVVDLSPSLSDRAAPARAPFALQGLRFGKTAPLILCGAAMPPSLNAEARQRLETALHSMMERISHAPVRRD
jgi:hypothetical protein